MTVEEAIRARVASLAAVIVLASTRVYLAKLPQKPTYPAVRVQLVDDPVSYHLRGPNGLRRARVQVDAFAEETSGGDVYARVTAVADAIDGDGKGTVATGLSGWIGSIGSPAMNIAAVFRIDRHQRYDAEELRLVTIVQDYYVWFHA